MFEIHCLDEQIKALPTIDENTASGSIATFTTNIVMPIPTMEFGISSAVNTINIKRRGDTFALDNKDVNDGYLADTIIRNDNTTATASGWFVTSFFELLPNADYEIVCPYGYSPAICFYDSSKNFISGEMYNNRTKFTVTTPNNTAFARLSSLNSALIAGATPSNGIITINLGSTVSDGSVKLEHKDNGGYTVKLTDNSTTPPTETDLPDVGEDLIALNGTNKLFADSGDTNCHYYYRLSVGEYVNQNI